MNEQPEIPALEEFRTEPGWSVTYGGVLIRYSLKKKQFYARIQVRRSNGDIFWMTASDSWFHGIKAKIDRVVQDGTLVL